LHARATAAILARFILHAIAVLGVNPKPLRGRLATATP